MFDAIPEDVLEMIQAADEADGLETPWRRGSARMRHLGPSSVLEEADRFDFDRTEAA